MKETLQATFFWMQVQCQYALKQNLMKFEFQNSIRRFSFLSHLPEIKIA